MNKGQHDFTDVTSKSEAERLGKLYPIILTKHNLECAQAYITERDYLLSIFGDAVLRVNHIGSTAVPGLVAKPTVDILLEIKENTDLIPFTERLQNEGYVVNTPPKDVILYLKGYTPEGFAGQVFHIHVRNFGDHDELYFRDYLTVHPEAAMEYGELNLMLKGKFEHDRDDYTEAKSEFIRRVTAAAREEYKERYITTKESRYEQQIKRNNMLST